MTHGLGRETAPAGFRDLNVSSGLLSITCLCVKIGVGEEDGFFRVGCNLLTIAPVATRMMTRKRIQAWGNSLGLARCLSAISMLAMFITIHYCFIAVV